jgi:acyl-CoA dehydrogenase
MSDTRHMLDAALDRLLTRRLPDGPARRAAGLSESLMDEVMDAGFARVLASEADGGLGGTLADAACVAWRCGWHAAPVPIVEMLLLSHLDAAADPAQVTLAHGDPAIAPSVPKVRSIRTGTSTIMANTARPFHHVSGAEWLRLEGVQTTHDDTTEVMGALLTAAAMTGAMARALDIVCDHAQTRSQFGRPLAGFQAIQHQLAEAASELTGTEAALANALDAHDAGNAPALLSNAAKARAGAAATKVAATAHQVMGAIGFTEIHELHHFTKLLWQWRDSWGWQADCEIAIGRAACAAENGLWAHITEL